jgi:hypothetical protein
MEATLRISLYSYAYTKLAEILYLSYYLIWFFFNKIGAEEGRQVLPGSGDLGEVVMQGGTNNVYTCK